MATATVDKSNMSDDERAEMKAMSEAIVRLESAVRTLTANLAIALKGIENLSRYVAIKEGLPDA